VAKRSRTRPAQPAPSAPTAPASSRRTTARRPTPRRTQEKTFLERNGTYLLIGLVAIGVVAIGYLFFTSSTQAAYTCGSLLTPGPSEAQPTPFPATPTPSATASPSPSPTAGPTSTASGTSAPSASPTAPASPTASPSPSASPSPVATPIPNPTARLGFTTTDLGRSHVPAGASVNYAFCAPTSGDHYNIPGQAPMPAAVYGPNTARIPQYWIHNLEHGYVVTAYRCPSGTLGQGDCISQQDLSNIQTWFDNAPAPTKSTCASKVLAVRFDSMDTQFALLAWDRVLLTDTFDIDTATTFAEQWMDSATTPESGAC